MRFRVGSGLLYFTSFVLAASSAAKLARVPKVTAQMAAIGFSGGKLTRIAFLELASAVLLAYPRSRPLGLLMVSAYLGGAICAHVAHDHPFLQPAIVLCLVWLAAWLRHPALPRGSEPSP
jgi:DoxX-like family